MNTFCNNGYQLAVSTYIQQEHTVSISIIKLRAN